VSRMRSAHVAIDSLSYLAFVLAAIIRTSPLDCHHEKVNRRIDFEFVIATLALWFHSIRYWTFAFVAAHLQEQQTSLYSQ
jgi:hypothetical protein